MKRFMLSLTTRLVCLTAAVCLSAAIQAATVTYTADDSTIFSNPERGFITMLEKKLSTSSPYCVKGQESTLDYHINRDGISIVLVHYYLDNFRNTATLPDAVLNGFDEDMQVLRNKGLKAILRFSYTNTTYEKNGTESAKDAPLDIAQSHISQYQSHWLANTDVIFVFQAGIVGAWGEWYYTDNYGNKQSTMNASRRAVVDALLAAVPQNRMIQLRTPLFKKGYVGDSNPLTATEAFTGTARARLGQHNDAFLYDYDNMGTYSDTATEKPWLAQETLYVPIGGETDITDVNKAKKWATYEKTTAEMSRLHWTFIQSGYATQTTDMWRQNGTFDELNRRMGYRYQLQSATFPDQVAAGGQMAVNITLRNVGYAPIYNERHAYIVLKNGSRTYPVQLASDPRRWLPNGVLTTVSEQLTIPANVPDGTYHLYLSLPDAYASLASDPRYAVRFANTGVWDAASGMNDLGVTVNVSGGAIPPVVDDGVLLPATLDQSNVDSYSDDMTWYNTTWFDFGPEDGTNTGRWAQWKVCLRYPGEYIVSENMASGGGTGHSWQLQLFAEGGALTDTYVADPTWNVGTITYDARWDLTAVPAGNYTLRVQNVMEWGQPKLQSLTLEYDGVLPTNPDDVRLTDPDDYCTQTFDILGRPVDASYNGLVIRNGRKYLQMPR